MLKIILSNILPKKTCDYLYHLGNTQELSDMNVSETAKKRLDVNILMEEVAQLKGEVKELIDKFISGKQLPLHVESILCVRF